MKRLLSLAMLLACCVTVTACTPSEEVQAASQRPDTPVAPDNNEDKDNGEDNNNENNNGENMSNKTINLTVGDTTFTATLADNSATRTLRQRLAQGDIVVHMNDYGDMEKVGQLGFSLPAENRQTTTGIGDMVLYQGNSLVIFYGRNSWSYTPLGKVDNVSTRERMLELLGGKGEIELTMSLD